ncbi:MAG: tetratricopeptide repeat protein [bacterium]|nr:tetratricopeptide repeat protein [bacterium]
MVRLQLASAYIGNGMYDEAVVELRRAMALSPVDLRPKARLGCVYALMGKRREALKILNDLNELSKYRHVSPYHKAVVHAALGDKAKALDWLEKAYEERDVQLTGLRRRVVLDSLRAEPRFIALLEKMNLKP